MQNGFELTDEMMEMIYSYVAQRAALEKRIHEWLEKIEPFDFSSLEDLGLHSQNSRDSASYYQHYEATEAFSKFTPQKHDYTKNRENLEAKMRELGMDDLVQPKPEYNVSYFHYKEEEEEKKGFKKIKSSIKKSFRKFKEAIKDAFSCY